MIHQRTKIIACISGLFIILSATAFFGFLYLVSKQEQTLQQELRVAAETESRRKAFDALITVTQKTAEERETLEKLLLREENIIEFLSLIETVAREQGVEVKTNNLTVVPLSSDFDSLDIDLTLRGTRAAVMHVIRLLETIPYQSRITRVLFTSISDEGVILQSDAWQARLDMSITKYRKQ